MPRKDAFYTARINIPLKDSLEGKRKAVNFPGKLSTYIEWLLQQYVDGKWGKSSEGFRFRDHAGEFEERAEPDIHGKGSTLIRPIQVKQRKRKGDS